MDTAEPCGQFYGIRLCAVEITHTVREIHRVVVVYAVHPQRASVGLVGAVPLAAAQAEQRGRGIVFYGVEIYGEAHCEVGCPRAYVEAVHRHHEVVAAVHVQAAIRQRFLPKSHHGKQG